MIIGGVIIFCIGGVLIVSSMMKKSNNKKNITNHGEEIAQIMGKVKEALTILQKCGEDAAKISLEAERCEFYAEKGDVESLKREMTSLAESARAHAERIRKERENAENEMAKTLSERLERMHRGHRFGNDVYEDIKALINNKQFDLATAALDRRELKSKAKSSSGAASSEDKKETA